MAHLPTYRDVPILLLDIADFTKNVGVPKKRLLLEELQKVLTTAAHFFMPFGDPWGKWKRHGTGDGYYFLFDALDAVVAAQYALGIRAGLIETNRTLAGDALLRVRIVLAHGDAELVDDQILSEQFAEAERFISDSRFKTHAADLTAPAAIACTELFHARFQGAVTRRPEPLFADARALQWTTITVTDKHGYVWRGYVEGAEWHATKPEGGAGKSVPGGSGQMGVALPSRLNQLPAPLTDFVGREEEVREMVARLRSDGGRVGLSALRGMGGVGKTTVAVHVAHQVKDRFPDAQLFIDLQGVAERPMTAVEAMARIIRDFHPEVPKLPETEAELLPIYRSTLSGKRALIVLDNAAGEAQVKNLVTGEKTAFIITSRNALALDGVASVRVDVLSPEKSLELLRGIVGTKGTDEELQTVAGLCGYLPLALRVAGDFLRLKEGWTVGRYIEALNQERLRWLKVGDDPQKDVEAVLRLSSAQLVRDNVDLATRWHFLADWPSDFAADAAAAAWDLDTGDEAVLEDLSELVDRSLVLFDERTFQYKLHDLMKPIAAGLFA